MIYLACDHGGYALKENLITYLATLGRHYKDLGCYSEESVDYPDYAHALAHEVAAHVGSMGIGICGSGMGISMALNRHAGIRAARCSTVEDVRLTRLHNDANVLCLGGRCVAPELAKEMLMMFLETAWEGGRHAARVAKIELLHD